MVSSFETERGKLDIQYIEVPTEAKIKELGLPGLPAVRIGSRFLSREEFSERDKFEAILRRVRRMDGAGGQIPGPGGR